MIEGVTNVKDFKTDKSNWVLTKLGDLANDISKRVNNPSESEYDRFVGLEHFVSGDIKIKKWSTTENLASSAKAFQAGDILFARRNAYLRRASLVDFDGCCSGDAFVLRENHDKVVPGFLAFLMNSNALWDFANSNAAGTMSKRVKWRDLANYEFLLPPKEQQAKIAKLLWMMGEIIERGNDHLAMMIQFSRSKQKELFTNSLFKSEKILNVAEVKRGKFTPRPRNDPKYFGGEIPFIQTGEVVESCKWINKFSQTLNEQGLTVSKMFERKTIVMTIAANIGYVGMLDFDSAFTDSLVGIKADESRISQEYLYYYLNYNQAQIESLATQSAQKNLSIEGFSSFSVRYPESKVEQNQIVDQLEILRETKISIKDMLKRSQLLQKSIINQIF